MSARGENKLLQQKMFEGQKGVDPRWSGESKCVSRQSKGKTSDDGELTKGTLPGCI